MGEYRLLVKEGPRGPGAQIKGDVQDAAGKRRFSFLHYIREEKKFDTPELLRAQIMKDVVVANRLHARLFHRQPQ